VPYLQCFGKKWLPGCAKQSGNGSNFWDIATFVGRYLVITAS
jgi:hypothetical protein